MSILVHISLLSIQSDHLLADNKSNMPQSQPICCQIIHHCMFDSATISFTLLLTIFQSWHMCVVSLCVSVVFKMNVQQREGCFRPADPLERCLSHFEFLSNYDSSINAVTFPSALLNVPSL